MNAMTPEGIDSLSLDDLSKECAKSIGWSWDDASIHSPSGSTSARFHPTTGIDELLWTIPEPAIDNGAAMELLSGLSIEWRLHHHQESDEVSAMLGGDSWGADTDYLAEYRADGKTPAEAISRAYLKYRYGTDNASGAA